jgi:hypothetical protein
VTKELLIQVIVLDPTSTEQMDQEVEKEEASFFEIEGTRTVTNEQEISIIEGALF